MELDGPRSCRPPKRLLVSLLTLCSSICASAGGGQGHLVQTVTSWEAGRPALHLPIHFKAAIGGQRELSTLLAQVFSGLLLGSRVHTCAERLPLLNPLPGLLSRTVGWGPSVCPPTHRAPHPYTQDGIQLWAFLPFPCPRAKHLS